MIIFITNIDGIIVLPSALSGIISTWLFLKIPTYEYIVPKSIPITGSPQGYLS